MYNAVCIDNKVSPSVLVPIVTMMEIQQAVSLQESIMSDKSHKTAMNSLDMSSYAY